ncbi:MAG TPA: cation-translocating P-type ATPase [Terriglobales bacterium]|jgi:heavy metal translocating P-type ATPase|nr:cation-translocating P-type ATPase [Terriglobales bacterium]
MPKTSLQEKESEQKAVSFDQASLRSVPPAQGAQKDHDEAVKWMDLARIALVAVSAIAVWFGAPYFNLIGAAGVAIGIYPIAREALDDILERKMTMELSMLIALCAALLIGELFTALVILAFVLAAEVLEGLTVRRGRTAIRNLLDLLPSTASLVSEGQVIDVPISDIQCDDLILVRPGARIPVDGEVEDGTSFVDESAITGEPMPVAKSAGKAIFAGTINQSGALHIRVEGVGRDTSFGKIVEAVEQAERSKAPIQRTADRLAGYLVYFALGSAVLTFLITHNVRSSISVIIVAGACGIAAGTPLAILGAVGRAAKQGAIIKGGLYLEVLAAVDTVMLDKTGTLTFGVPEVVEINPFNGLGKQDILQAAAIAELRSEHPVGRAIVKRALQQQLPVPEPTNFGYEPGRGVWATVEGAEIAVGSAAMMRDRGLQLPASTNSSVGSSVFVARRNVLLGSIVVSDKVRPEAETAMKDLKAMGIDTVLLTGDAKSTANTVAKSLGVTSVYAELLPEQKLHRVREEVQLKKTVAMVGDGINDAPALAEASIGIAMGSGTDVARESADVVLIGNDLSRFVESLRIARKCRSVIMQNFYGTLTVDAAGIVLAAFGFLNPLLAAFIHVSSELVFILNSTRMLPGRD